MPKYFTIPILFLFSAVVSLNAQSEFFCLNGSDNPYQAITPADAGLAERSVCDPFRCTGAVVNVKFHVLHMDNGTDGYTEGDVTSCKTLLNTAFNPQGITFNYLPTHHWNKSFYLTQTSLAILSIFSDAANQRTSDAIHVYLIKNPQLGAGKADGIPSNACFMGGSATYGGITYQLVPSHVVSHEVGHCMGLQHTFNNFTPGTPKTEADPCTMGDFVADTPVDPVTTKDCILPSSCTYQPYGGQCPLTDNSGNAYTPNLNNYMSYTVTTCMNQFTSGQGDKMRDDAMAGIPGVFKLPDIVSVPNQTNMCPNSTHTLSVCFPGTITWSVVPAGAVTFTSIAAGNSTVNVTPTATGAGTITITAMASNGQTKQITKNIVTFASFNGTYNNNGGISKNLNTVNAISAGTVYVTLQSGNTYTWNVQSGSPVGLWVSLGGSNASFSLYSGSVTFYITTSPCNVGRTVTFYVGTGFGLAAWPNPASDVLNIQADRIDDGVLNISDDPEATSERGLSGTEDADMTVQIRNTMGELVYSGRLDAGGRAGVDVSGLTNGVYLVAVSGKSGVASTKVVISR